MAQLNRRTQTQLTAPGVTADLKLSPYAASRHYRVVVAAINTSLVVRAEYAATASGSVTGRGFDYTITANGTYTLPVFATDNFVHLNFVSEAGGFAATVDATLVEETN